MESKNNLNEKKCDSEKTLFKTIYFRHTDFSDLEKKQNCKFEIKPLKSIIVTKSCDLITYEIKKIK